MTIDVYTPMIAIFEDQIDWSNFTHGPPNPDRLSALLLHIQKEIEEIRKCPADLVEWVDLAILAFDGAWRYGGATARDIVVAYIEKMEINKRRKWPDWRTLDPSKPSEHVRTTEED